MASSAAAAAMLAAGLLIPMFFGSNDDPYAIQILSGGGGVAAEPLPMVPFINYGLCWIFSSLYSVLPVTQRGDGSPAPCLHGCCFASPILA